MTDFDSESDAALVLMANHGTPEVFGALFSRHKDRVFRHALARLGSWEDAEDVTAVVFLEAWRRRNGLFFVDGSALPWLLTTTNFVVKNHQRWTRRHQAFLAALPNPEDVEDHAPAVLNRTDQEVWVREAFGRLRLSDQDVLTLALVEEMSMAQIADALTLPEGTVKSRLSRAKKRFEALLLAVAAGKSCLPDEPTAEASLT